MSTKRKIKASEIVRDIRDGMSNRGLMEKYGILPEQLTGVFDKLIDARVMSTAELAFRMSSGRMTVSDVKVRQSSRSYPPVTLKIYDLDDLASELGVKDLSEDGLHVVGMDTSVGETASFLIQALQFDDIDAITFDAQCRWTRIENLSPEETLAHAGFAITDIDDHSREQLMKFIAKFPHQGD